MSATEILGSELEELLGPTVHITCCEDQVPPAVTLCGTVDLGPNVGHSVAATCSPCIERDERGECSRYKRCRHGG